MKFRFFCAFKVDRGGFKRIALFSLACLLSGLGNQSLRAQYAVPFGIPDPGWGQTHPINTQPPAPPSSWPGAPTSGYYYVDSSQAGSTDSSNPFGHPAKPRKTIPAQLAAGSYVEVANLTNLTTITATGTDSSPVWIVGTGSAIVQPRKVGNFLRILNSRFVLIQGLNFDGTGTPSNAASVAWNVRDSHHVSIRTCTVHNMPIGPYDPTRFGSGGAALWYGALTSMGPENADITDIVIFGCTISDNGGGQFVDYESGRHGILCAGGTTRRIERVWILKNIINNNPEDAIQLGLSAAGADQTLCRFFYIGDNVLANCGENAIDLKATDHIVVSRNRMSGFRVTAYRSGAVSGSDGAACVINDDGGGPLHSWWFYNTISDSRIAWRNQALGGDHYFVGNLISDLHKRDDEGEPITVGRNGGVGYWGGTPGPSAHFAYNTFFQVHGGIYINNSSALTIKGNLVYDLVDHTAGWPININNSTSRDLGGNNYFDPDGSVRRDADALAVSDLININPLLTDPSAGVLTVLATSPALALSPSVVTMENAYAQAFNTTISFSLNRALTPPGVPVTRPGPPTGVRIVSP